MGQRAVRGKATRLVLAGQPNTITAQIWLSSNVNQTKSACISSQAGGVSYASQADEREQMNNNHAHNDPSSDTVALKQTHKRKKRSYNLLRIDSR
jgi:hypothetical protein